MSEKLFADKLSAWIKRLGLTHPAASARLGCSVFTFRGWLYGKHEPSSTLKTALLKIIEG